MKYQKYILCSRACSSLEYSRLFKDDSHKTSQSIQKYYRVFCEGFVRNGKTICVYSRRPVSKEATGKYYLPSKEEFVNGIFYHYTRIFNIKGLDFLYTFLSSLFWFIIPRNCDKSCVIIFDPLSVFQSLGCLLACKLRGVTCVAYATDLAMAYSFGYRWPLWLKKLSTWIQTHADAMIFVTEQMNDASNPKSKPYIVIEGCVDEGMLESSNTIEKKHKSKVVLYAGGLAKHYGLDMLIDGFIKANVDNSELHIYGSGPYTKEVQSASERFDKIKFFGVKDNSVVIEEQIKATLLVNPRYTDADYTKYSFPGKNMEYMVSGTATLTTVLPGMPKEYYPYVYLLKNETVDGMAVMLKDLLNKPTDEVYNFGQRAKEFVIENKSNSAQVKRFIDFINTID